MMGNWNYGGYGIGWSGMLFGWVLMLAFWALVIWAIVAFIQWVMMQKDMPTKNSALSILEERYAKGEISKEEFEEKKGGLTK